MPPSPFLTLMVWVDKRMARLTTSKVLCRCFLIYTVAMAEHPIHGIHRFLVLGEQVGKVQVACMFLPPRSMFRVICG